MSNACTWKLYRELKGLFRIFHHSGERFIIPRNLSLTITYTGGKDMGSIAFITGKLNPYSGSSGNRLEEVVTSYGRVRLYRADDHIVLPRHGIENNIPPHRIEHRANIAALAKMGVKRIVAFYSVGSLKRSLGPGEIIVVDDYIDLGTPSTFFDNEIRHITPSLQNSFRHDILSLIRNIGIPHRGRGIYIRTRGPRLETMAEIAMLANFGDVVGMTMCDEATLACEKEMEFCPVCFVDNYCNGVVDEVLSFEMIRDHADKNRQIVTRIMKEIAQ